MKNLTLFQIRKKILRFCKFEKKILRFFKIEKKILRFFKILNEILRFLDRKTILRFLSENFFPMLHREYVRKSVNYAPVSDVDRLLSHTRRNRAERVDQ